MAETEIWKAPMTLRVTHVTPSFWPATYWGGPIFSTKAICDGLQKRPDITLRVLTTDSAGPRARDRVTQSASGSIGYEVCRARRLFGASVAPGLLLHLLRVILESDVIHLTGTYSFPTLPTLLLARLTRTPVVWSPRGAIQATVEWEDAPRRHLKGAFQWIADFIRPKKTVLHVTSEDERCASMQALRDIKACVIPNSVFVEKHCCERSWRPDGQMRLMFLSRMHPKKGLEDLIDAMQRLPNWFRLDVYGDGAASYLSELAIRIDGNERIAFYGQADEAIKLHAFANADLFVLPSKSENFGIVVAEALANGVPVLTTNKTPWRDLDRYGCGHCYDPEKDNLADEVMAFVEKDLKKMGQRGREWMRREFSQDAVCADFADLYFELAGNRPSKDA